MSSCEYCETSTNTFLTEHLWVTACIIYSNKYNNCVNDILKKQLEENEREPVTYMDEYFESMFEDKNFLRVVCHCSWLQTVLFKKLVCLKLLKNRKTNLKYQQIYDFLLQKSIICNDSVNSSKHITKMNFPKNYENIFDPEGWEEEKTCKWSCNVTMIVAT